ncbi:MAG: hypothetical protein ACT4OK_06430 [Gemmobacter sp.]
MMRIAPLFLLLAACSPQAAVDNFTDRAARSVVVNVLVNQYPRPQAETATTCVIRNADPSEVEALARDVGARAGTTTVARIRAIGNRPATQGCLASQGLAPIAVVP